MAESNGAAEELRFAPTYLGKSANCRVAAGPLPITDLIRTLLYPEGHRLSDAQDCAGDGHVVTTAEKAEQIMGRIAELEVDHMTLLGTLSGVRGGRDLALALLEETQAEVARLEDEIRLLNRKSRPIMNRMADQQRRAVQ